LVRAWRRRRKREAPLVDFQNARDFEKWLGRKPREVAVTLAERAALRVLQVVWRARTIAPEVDIQAVILLPVFRAASVAWAAAKYPDRHWTLATAANAASASVADARAVAGAGANE
jgi:hypothetical protein